MPIRILEKPLAWEIINIVQFLNDFKLNNDVVSMIFWKHCHDMLFHAVVKWTFVMQQL